MGLHSLTLLSFLLLATQVFLLEGKQEFWKGQSIIHEENIAMKTVCPQMDHKFSCVPAGNPASCMACFKSEMMYWTICSFLESPE
uniref:fibroblast growth factor-binding protein 1-like n=1 Tax=Odobenus rosmarus divergens TaxID=9708 RepID=UPI00063C0268|nr:PREDICTED: fibroblast growth factor-binding protein 1-like [Odobenus rosmarus divergens]